MQLILASQSPYRKAQLEDVGLAFTAVKPAVDEEALKLEGPTNLAELTRFLAFHKAESVRGTFPDAVILGSDQIAEVQGHRLDKPGTREKAIQQLQSLQGRTHYLITSLCVNSPTLKQTFTEIATIRMRKLTRAEIEAYVDLDQPLDCAGSYKIERGGRALIDRLDCRDESSIQGLPLLSLKTALQKLAWPELELKWPK